MNLFAFFCGGLCTSMSSTSYHFRPPLVYLSPKNLTTGSQVQTLSLSLHPRSLLAHSHKRTLYRNTNKKFLFMNKVPVY